MSITELIKKTHKIIHKQGFDTFYRLRNQIPDKFGFSQEEETKLFAESPEIYHRNYFDYIYYLRATLTCIVR